MWLITPTLNPSYQDPIDHTASRRASDPSFSDHVTVHYIYDNQEHAGFSIMRTPASSISVTVWRERREFGGGGTYFHYRLSHCRTGCLPCLIFAFRLTYTVVYILYVREGTECKLSIQYAMSYKPPTKLQLLFI